MKSYRLYILILCAALALVVLAEVFRTPPVNWNESFSRSDKVPYGAWILYQQLENLFPGEEIEVNDETIYQRLAGDTTEVGTYFLLNDRLDLSGPDTKQLLSFISRGGHAFLAAENFTGPLFDTLGIETSGTFSFMIASEFGGDGDTVQVNFASPALRAEEPYPLYARNGFSYFVLFNEDSSVVLETTASKSLSERKVTFIKVVWGEGAFFLSTTPRAFTNIGLLGSRGIEHAAVVFSSLPSKKVIWDESYKPEDIAGGGGSESSLRYILSREAFRLAWYSLLLGIVLFIVFGARRRQRIIPVVEPPRNTTLDFVETVGRLYHQSGDFRSVADKQITYLLEYVRTHLNLPTHRLDGKFIERVSERSGLPLDRLQQLFGRIEQMQAKRREMSANELLSLNNDIEYFYQNTER